MSAGKVSVLGVGDTVPGRPHPETLFELALPTLRQADILFGQLEANLSEKGERQRQAPTGKQIPSDRVSGLTYAGFDVMSFAGNHHLDRGDEAFFETINTLTTNNIAVIGVGKNIDEARRPLILERNGNKVAFLAYCSVLPKGFEATRNTSGCAPMRASTFYEQTDWQPGTAPKIVTLAHKEDLSALVEDVKKVKPLADVVVMSIHWGVHFVPAVIAMYQKEVAYAAIDAGVDVIFGHHAHILKGIEVYKGKPIFYSLCNFVQPSYRKGQQTSYKAAYGIALDEEYLDYDYPVDSRKSIIAKCIISDKKLLRAGYLPLMINKHAQPEVLTRGDPRSGEVYDYVKWCCTDQKITTDFSWDGDEVVIGL